MAVPSVFELYRLAVGPGLALTTGALKIGQAFRELLTKTPYKPHHRILIELMGNYGLLGKEYHSNIAVVCGLGGYTLGESAIKMTTFYKKIEATGAFSFIAESWPFNPESDVVYSVDPKQNEYPNTIRFHLVDKSNNPLFQAEYICTETGIISGPGLTKPGIDSNIELIQKFSEMVTVMKVEGISPADFMISAEMTRMKLNHQKVITRMIKSWQIMGNILENGLHNRGILPDYSERQAFKLYEEYRANLHLSTRISTESSRAAVFAWAFAEEILDSHLIITSPTCSGAGIVPAVFRVLQEKYLLSDEKMAEGLMVAGLIGTQLLYRLHWGNLLEMNRKEISMSAAMAVAGALYLLGKSIDHIGTGSYLALQLLNGKTMDYKIEKSGELIIQNALAAQSVFGILDLTQIITDHSLYNLDQAIHEFGKQEE